jgi:hypothetical protein
VISRGKNIPDVIRQAAILVVGSGPGGLRYNALLIVFRRNSTALGGSGLLDKTCHIHTVLHMLDIILNVVLSIILYVILTIRLRNARCSSPCLYDERALVRE